MPAELKIITPENVVINFRLAGLFSRGQAFMLDLTYQFFIFLLSTALLNTLFSNFFKYQIVEALTIGCNFFIFWGYHIFFEVFYDGQTLGKKAAGIRVVTLNGQKVSFFQSAARNLLRIADFLPVFFPAGIITMICSNFHQRLGDIFSKTIVVMDTFSGGKPSPEVNEQRSWSQIFGFDRSP